MNKIVKLVLIAIVFIGIVVAFIYFASGIDSGVGKPIAVTAFEKHVQQRTDNDIKGKQYPDAHDGYVSIINELNTEASITLGNGEKNLSDSEIEKSKQIAFYEYAPIFTKYALEYFQKASWDDAVLKELKNESISLLDTKVAEVGTATEKDLKQISKTVDSYYAAWKVANGASHCNSVGAIAQVKKNANSYKYAPLTNNASLLSALNSAESNAKSSVIRIIRSHCDKVSQGYKNYSNYASFNSAYENACRRIEEYKQSYGYPDELKSARSRLVDADASALPYYKELEKQKNNHHYGL